MKMDKYFQETRKFVMDKYNAHNDKDAEDKKP